MIKHYAMKAYGGMAVYIHIFLTSALAGNECSTYVNALNLTMSCYQPCSCAQTYDENVSVGLQFYWYITPTVRAYIRSVHYSNL
jgi:hypothetical protein